MLTWLQNNLYHLIFLVALVVLVAMGVVSVQVGLPLIAAAGGYTVGVNTNGAKSG